MADFNNPTVDDEYTQILPVVRDNIKVSVTMNYDQSLNIPIGAVEFVSGVFSVYNGSTFNAQPISIGGGGTGAKTASGARNALSVYSKSEVDSKDTVVQSNLNAHINDTSGAHTKAAVGLGNIPNSKSDSYTLNSSSTLATSKAVRDLNNALSSDINDVDDKLTGNYYTSTYMNSFFARDSDRGNGIIGVWSGRVSDSGGWVTRPNSSWTVTRLSEGDYRVSYSQLNTSFIPVVSLDPDGIADVIKITNITTDSFDVKTRIQGVGDEDSGFTFIVHEYA